MLKGKWNPLSVSELNTTTTTFFLKNSTIFAEIVDIVYYLLLKTHNVQRLGHQVEWEKGRTYFDGLRD
jgi:hypothetical protein